MQSEPRSATCRPRDAASSAVKSTNGNSPRIDARARAGSPAPGSPKQAISTPTKSKLDQILYACALFYAGGLLITVNGHTLLRVRCGSTGTLNGDLFHLERYDLAHSRNEDRYLTLASDPENRVIVYCIAWTKRTVPDGFVTRIISDRMATRTERRSHEKHVAN